MVSEGVHDVNMWRLMSTVDLLKHGIPDPSSITLSHPHSSSLGSDKESKDKIQEAGEEYMAAPVFVHTKLHDQDLAPHNFVQLKKALNQYFSSSTFVRPKRQNTAKEHVISSMPPSCLNDDPDSAPLKSFLVPSKNNDDLVRANYKSYRSMLWKLRDQVLSMSGPSFSRTVSERDWLKNSAKIWDLVKNSSIISEYSKTLQSSGMFKK